MEPTYTFFYNTQNLNLKKNLFFFEILNLQKFVCLKKMTPKSQAKNKTPFT